jgi:hypothetical protein
MGVKQIVGAIIVIILIIILLRYLFSDVNTLSGLMSGKTMQKIEPDGLESGGGSSNFSYSIWLYIDDWNYRYGDSKMLFGRMAGDIVDVAAQPCPSLALGSAKNNLVVSTTVYDDALNASSSAENFQVQTFVVDNIDIQKWVNVTVATHGRTMDIYLDGKLVRTCILNGVPKINTAAPVYVTPNGGFSGWTSKFQYWNDTLNPQEVWNIYARGYGGSWLGGLLGTYSVKLSLMEGDTEKSSLEI